MKLIDREPTLEMIGAARFYKEGTHTLACAWRAMYDAAPEVKQEPVAIVGELYPQTKLELNRRGIPVGAFLYTFPPDAQAEITKRDERIKELKNKAELPMKYKRMQFNAELQKEVAKQAAEIARLNAVIAKCHSAISQCKQWQEGTNTLTCHNHDAVEDALTAIKEIEKC